MKHIAFLIFILLPIGVIGQNNARIDSLKSALRNDNGNVALIKEILEYYKTENIDSLNAYANQFLTTANDEIAIQIALIKVDAYLTFNDIENAELEFNKLTISEKPTPEIQVKYTIANGRILKSKRQLDKALNIFYEAVQIAQQHQMKALLPELYFDIAYVLSQNNDLENATKYYRMSLKKAQENSNIELEIEVYFALCRVYNGGITVNLDSSVYYGELGIEIAKKANYERGYADMLYIVSAPIIRNGEYRKGLEMSQEALKYAKKYNFSLKSRYYLTLNQGFAYEKLGKYDSAMLIMEEGRRLRPSSIDHYRLKYLIHKAIGQYALALEASEIYAKKKDSVIRGRNKAKLSSLQARLEADLKEQEVQSLTQKTTLQSFQLQQQRYIMIIFSVVGLLLIGGGLLLYRQRKLKQQQAMTNLELVETKKRLAIEKQYRLSELKALRSQMNPHFVFNALNSIQEFIVLNEKKLAGKYLGKFADLMRTYLNHSQIKSVTIQEEVDVLNLYLELEKLRFEESLSYEVIVDHEVDANLLSIPSLLIQPYVENALKHGLLHKKDDRRLSVNFSYNAVHDLVECAITDNGIGRAASAEINKMRNPNHKSFATAATKNRLDLLNHSSDKPVGEQVEDLFDVDGMAIGTKVVLKIPITEFAT